MCACFSVFKTKDSNAVMRFANAAVNLHENRAIASKVIVLLSGVCRMILSVVCCLFFVDRNLFCKFYRKSW